MHSSLCFIEPSELDCYHCNITGNGVCTTDGSSCICHDGYTGLYCGKFQNRKLLVYLIWETTQSAEFFFSCTARKWCPFITTSSVPAIFTGYLRWQAFENRFMETKEKMALLINLSNLSNQR